MPPRRLFGVMRFGKFFCIAPWFNRKENSFNETIWWKFYQGGILLVTCLMYALLMYCDIRGAHKSMEPHEKLLWRTITGILFVVNLTTLINTVFSKKSQWKEIIRKVVSILEKLREISTEHDMENVEYSTNLSYLLTSALPVINLILFIIAEQTQPHFVILSHIPYFQLTASLLLIEDVGTMLKLTFQSVSEAIKREFDTEIKIESFDVILVEEAVEESPKQLTKKAKVVQKSIEIYSDCYEVTTLYNNIFGWSIVLICLLAVVGVLPGLETIIWKIVPNDYTRSSVVLSTVTISAWKLFACFVLIETCQKAADEGESIKITATNALQLLPESKKYEDLQKELSFLVDLIDGCPPTFSAARVFPVNYALYYILFTTITSNLVVLVQFLQTPNA